jgi:hypothetical protein
MTPKELDELERRCLTDWLMTEQGETTLKLIHELRAAARERDDARAKALQEAASTCRELASLSDSDTDESAGLKKAARAVETLAQHRGEAGGSDE